MLGTRQPLIESYRIPNACLARVHLESLNENRIAGNSFWFNFHYIIHLAVTNVINIDQVFQTS